MLERYLAPGEQAPLDYTVYSVVIFTLAIVLVVEVLRHQLDVVASGNPFFQTVLELMYRELTTLGIVEFFIYLLHKYDEDFNYAMEVIFVDVHFMLFYTALFNAIQSVLVRLLTSRRTDKTWVQTEDIDIGHYVAIRKEFDRVEDEWKRLQHYNNSSDPSLHPNNNNHVPSVRSSSFNDTSEGNTTEHEVEKLGVMQKVRRFVHDLLMKLRYPRLYIRKRKLLVPVRYHELRCHFIEQNRLSSKFQVSQYLKRSLTSVLLDFVHISSTAWIMVMVLVVFLYYISGIILHTTETKVNVWQFVVYVMASLITLFLVIALILFFKMRSVFSKILVMKLTIQDGDGQKSWRGFNSALRTGMKTFDQLSLFWGNNPRVIIVLTQFMQFGYALGLAAIFTYWSHFEETNPHGGISYKNAMLGSLLVSYVIFLHLLADILPWFTLCTSLGQLVDKERLHETMAKLKLSEELRKAEAAAEAAAFEAEQKRLEERVRARESREIRKEQKRSHIEDDNDATFSEDLNGIKPTQQRPKGRERSLSGGVRLMRMFHDRGSEKGDTTRRRANRKSLSDGVQFMSKLQITSEDVSEIFHSASRLSDAAAEQLFDTNELDPQQADPVRMTSMGHRRDLSAIVESPICSKKVFQPTSQANASGNGMLALSSQPKPSTDFMNGDNRPESKSYDMNDDSLNKTPAKQDRKQRRRVMKSQSEGVAFMRSSMDTANAPKTSLPIAKDIEQEVKLEALSELVHMSAKDLPDIPEAGKKDRRPRIRTISDEVSLMRADSSGSNLTKPFASSAHDDSTMFTRQVRRPRRERCKSEGVAFMRASLHSKTAAERSLAPIEESKQQTKLEPLSEVVKLPEKVNRRERRSRLRSISDGVSLMRAVNQTGQTLSSSIEQNTIPVESEVIHKEVSVPDKKVNFTEEDDEPTGTVINSVESVNGESDIDDVPDIMVDGRSLIVTKKSRLGDVDLAVFFQCYSYKNLSLLFGPLICCFLVAMRVEGFNIEEGVLKNYHNTFQFELVPTFWLECCWYCLMLVELVVALSVFLTKSNYTGTISAVVGILVNIACLALLLVAEAKRCCPSHDSDVFSRLLAAADPYTSAYENGEASYNTNNEDTDCCGQFGSRTYGGLGSIEPYTFLVALSPLRFIVAEVIARMCGLETNTEVSHEMKSSHGHHHESYDEVRDFWLRTIGHHSEIAKKYGLFSPQILYCMLGLDVEDKNTGEVYNGSLLDIVSQLESTPHESSERAETIEITSNRELASPTVNNSLNIVFDESQFAFPESKLIRRMRRCERRLLPLLDQWMLVDVVLTSHELVILDVPDDVLQSDITCLGDGGRGLSLNVVARGRHVLSTFLLNDIDFIDIEHSLSIGGVDMRDIESNRQQLGEFWQGCGDSVGYDPSEMSRRWCSVDEDRLKIHFTSGCGTLYLRILLDLKEKELARINPLSRDESPSLLANVGSETKIWCRTIARLRGVANLRMNLPHFGNAACDDELGDFIKVTDRESSGKRHHRRLSTRIASLTSLQHV